jgi:hypothetical protein
VSERSLNFPALHYQSKDKLFLLSPSAQRTPKKACMVGAFGVLGVLGALARPTNTPPAPTSAQKKARENPGFLIKQTLIF